MDNNSLVITIALFVGLTLIGASLTAFVDDSADGTVVGGMVLPLEYNIEYDSSIDLSEAGYYNLTSVPGFYLRANRNKAITLLDERIKTNKVWFVFDPFVKAFYEDVNGKTTEILSFNARQEQQLKFLCEVSQGQIEP